MADMKHTPEPWVYRPDSFDDWGFIRSNKTLVAIAKDSSIDDSEFDAFRANKSDPYEANASRIVTCINALAGIENPAEWVERMKLLEHAYYLPRAEREAYIDKMIKQDNSKIL